MRIQGFAVAISTLALCAACQAATPSEVAATAIKEAKLTNVERVEVSDAASNKYTFFIWYQPNKGSVSKAKADTTRLVRSTLALLIASGAKPSEDWTRVNAHAAEGVTGETGKKMAVDYGSSRYNFALDRIDYEAPNR